MTRLLPHEEKQRWILKLPVFIKHYLADILSWVSTAAVIVLTALAFFDDVHLGWVVGLGFLAIASSILSMVSKKRHDTSIRDAESLAHRLQDDQQEAARYLRQVIHQQFVELLDEAGMVNDHTRVSIYQHDPQRGKFIPVGRASDNPELEKWGRTEYPDHYGIIHEAWTKRIVPQFRLSNDPEEWVEEQRRLYNVPLDVARAIRMKSRSYIGLRIDYGPNGAKVGIAILESLKPQRVNSWMSDSVKNTDAFHHLALALAVGPKPPQTLPDTNARPSKSDV